MEAKCSERNAAGSHIGSHAQRGSNRMPKRRRVRSPHPGVVILKRVLPSGAVRFQARYRDPISGRTLKPLLDPVALRTTQARTLWAKALHESLAVRRAARKA